VQVTYLIMTKVNGFTPKQILERVDPTWRLFFPTKTQAHYDIPPDDNVTTNLTPFIPMIVTTLTIVTVITALKFARAKRRRVLDIIAFFYLVLSCIIHFTIELYWARNNDKIFTDTGMIAKLWQEFGKCDTRWWSQDEVIFSLEFMAGYFCGPMAFITIVAFIFDKPYRHILQAVTCTAEAYGLIITWIPAYFSGLIHVPVNNPVMYYGYFWAMQCPWLIIPIILVIDSCIYISKLERESKKNESSKKNR